MKLQGKKESTKLITWFTVYIEENCSTGEKKKKNSGGQW
jgi:hypothetical protein